MFITDIPGEDLPVSTLIGQPAKNGVGETFGEVHELIMDKHGHITTVLIEVGGFLGVAEKIVAIPFSSVEIDTTAPGKPAIIALLGKQDLAQAPQFKWTERSPFGRLKDQGAALGQMAAAKASEFIHKAGEKASEVGEMAVEKASEVGEMAAAKASEVGEMAVEKASELSHKAAEKASEIGQQLAEKASELTRKVARNGDDPGRTTSASPTEKEEDGSKVTSKE